MPRGIPKSGKRIIRKSKFGSAAGPGSQVPLMASIASPDEGTGGGMAGATGMKRGGKTKRKGAKK